MGHNLRKWFLNLFLLILAIVKIISLELFETILLQQLLIMLKIILIWQKLIIIIVFFNAGVKNTRTLVWPLKLILDSRKMNCSLLVDLIIINFQSSMWWLRFHNGILSKLKSILCIHLSIWITYNIAQSTCSLIFVIVFWLIHLHVAFHWRILL